MWVLRSLRAPEPLRRSDRRIATVTTVTGLVQGFGTGLLTATLPFARVTLGVSEGGMSLVLAVTRLGSLAAVAFSVYGDRRGRRRPFLWAFLLFCLAGAATSLAPGVVTFALAQAVARAGTVALSALAVVLLAEALSPPVRAYGISFYAVAGSIGGGGALLLLPLADRGEEGWRILFALSALGVVLYPFLAWALRESLLFRPAIRVAAAWRASPLFWRLAAISFLVNAYSSVGISFVFERLINDLGWSAPTARMIVIGGGSVGALGLFAGGRMADLWGRRPTTVVALALGLGGGVGFYWVESGWLLAVAIAVGSFGSSAFIPSFTAHRSELFPTSVRATTGAWLNTAGVVGSLVSFGLGFLLINRIGLSVTITLLGMGVAVAAGLVLGLPETRGSELTPD